MWCVMVFNVRVVYQSAKREKLVEKKQLGTPKKMIDEEVMGTLLT